MAKIAITAVFKPKNGHKDALLDELEKVKKVSRKEEGCLQYDLHQSIESNTIFLYEVWKDSGAVQNHIETVHYKTYRDNTEDLFRVKRSEQMEFDLDCPNAQNYKTYVYSILKQGNL